MQAKVERKFPKISAMSGKSSNFAGQNKILIYTDMAKPIKETPILTGTDAEHFAYSVEHPRAVTKEEVERALAVYEKLSKCSELV